MKAGLILWEIVDVFQIVRCLHFVVLKVKTCYGTIFVCQSRIDQAADFRPSGQSGDNGKRANENKPLPIKHVETIAINAPNESNQSKQRRTYDVVQRVSKQVDRLLHQRLAVHDIDSFQVSRPVLDPTRTSQAPPQKGSWCVEQQLLWTAYATVSRTVRLMVPTVVRQNLENFPQLTMRV